MAESASNPKIEKLRFQLKSDPKSRIFFPLAEELRKAGQLAEAEQVLRTGLATHPTYLSGWVSLGRSLRDLQKHGDAIEALKKAMQIDPGNVVAARLLAESYESLGEKVEAIKKYKLVAALFPGDEELEAIIQRLDAEINKPLPIPEPEQFAAPAAAAEGPFISERTHPGESTTPFGQQSPVFDEAVRVIKEDTRDEIATGDAEPMSVAHEESPFEEPVGFTSAALDIEQPSGFQVAPPPLSAEVPAPLPADEADVFEPSSDVAPGFVQGTFDSNAALPPPATDDFAKTITMADLYASQGLVDEARDIYEDILARDPSNSAIRAKLDALSPGTAASTTASAAEAESPLQNPKVDKLQKWLSKVKSKEVGGV